MSPGPNRFAALLGSCEQNEPGSRSAKKKERAAEHVDRSPVVLPGPVQYAPKTPVLLSHQLLSQQRVEEAGGGMQGPCAAAQGPPTAKPAEQPQYTLALTRDNLLVARQSGSGRQLACFTVSGAEQAADPGFLHMAHAEVQRVLGKQRQQQREQQQQQQEEPGAWQQEQEWGGSRAWWGAADWSNPDSCGVGSADEMDEEVSELMAMLMGTGTGSSGPAATAAAKDARAAAPPLPAARSPMQRAVIASLAQLDWYVAAALQEEEDGRFAAAHAATEAAVLKAEAAEADAAAAAAAQAPSDWELAQLCQEEEDAASAAALAAEEQAAAGQAATATSSGFWAQLRSEGAPPAGSTDMRSSRGLHSPAAPHDFPSLQAAGGGGTSSGLKGVDRTREQLLRQHRSTKQVGVERGTGVRLLHRSGCSPAVSPALRAGSRLPGGEAGVGGGAPPLQMEGGLRFLEDDLDMQLLLRDEGVTAAARAAADVYAEQAEACEGGRRADASANAMRSMIDASSRREAAASAGTSRPGSAGGGGGGVSGLAVSGADLGEAGEAVSRAAPASPPEPVDTKSLRRLLEDMRRRGWQLMGCAGGGHIRCERRFPDLPAFKQVYFLASTPSDVNYIWNVAAAVKRFDREVADCRAAAAAAALEMEAAPAQPSSQQAAASRPRTAGPGQDRRWR